MKDTTWQDWLLIAAILCGLWSAFGGGHASAVLECVKLYEDDLGSGARQYCEDIETQHEDDMRASARDRQH